MEQEGIAARRRAARGPASRNLRGATVVITGASSGIGAATAEGFARAGSRLFLAARDGKGLEAVARKCRELGAEASAVPTDVTDCKAVEELASKALAQAGRIDVWVSNVGVGAVGRFERTPMAAHEQVVRANLVGHMNDAHAVLPRFLEQGSGVFINMISLGGFAGAPFAAAYSASKFGLRGFSEALRGELAGYPDIHVCDVYPGFVDTPGIGHSANYTGRKLSAPPPVYDPHRVAAAIVDVARKPRPETVVGSVVHLVRIGHLFAPYLSARVLGRIMQSYFRHARQVPITEGNLFVPADDAGRIDGGLRSRRYRGVALATGAAVALLLATILTGARRPADPSD